MSRLISRSAGSLGGRILPPNEQGGDEGDGEGERIFFDDGQVRVTESLVTIGHPWNKAFAVREITSVTYGKNKSNDLSASILRSLGWLALGLGLLVGLAGFWPGLVFGLFVGIGSLLQSRKKDAPYSVTMSTIPEPSTFSLFLVSLGALLWRGRSKDGRRVYCFTARICEAERSHRNDFPESGITNEGGGGARRRRVTWRRWWARG